MFSDRKCKLKYDFEYDTQGTKFIDVHNKTQYTPIYAKQNQTATYGEKKGKGW